MGSLYPRRKVLPDKDPDPWWVRLGGYHDFQLELECGHWVSRRVTKPPKHVYCEKCLMAPIGPVLPCPECKSTELCYADCSIAPWNLGDLTAVSTRDLRCRRRRTK